MAALSLERLGPTARRWLRVVASLVGPGVEPVLVGGVVRDVCLGRSAGADVDVAVPRGALELARRVADRVGGAFVVLDPERGAARVVSRDGRLDLTDFRAPTLEEDLRGRDFTVNALAVPVRELLRRGVAPLVDPTGGLADLVARRLRPASPGALAADPARALRAVRLAELLGLRMTPATARAVARAAPALGAVSAERVRDELLGLLALPAAGRALRRAERLGLLAAVLPEVEPMRAAAQPPPHRFDVLEHSLRAVAGADEVVARVGDLEPFGEELAVHLGAPLGGGVTRAQLLKLAALLHDVGKPETRQVVDGRIRFFGHELVGAARARAIGTRLRLPGAVTAALERLVRHHLRPMHLAEAGVVTPRARYRLYRDLGAETRDLLLLALVDAAAVRGQSPVGLWPRAALLRDLLAGWAEQLRAAAAPPLVRGEDVMARYGLPPGPQVGRLLRQAREAQDLGLVRTRDEALAYLDSCVGSPGPAAAPELG
jgi:putative nucleotidyltransferase with HDIG domain